MKKFKCCLCGNLTSGYGNNPDGAVWKDESGNVVIGKFNENDKCCDLCNMRFVIPGRMYLIKKQEMEENK